jgi:hypothetical protein
LLTFYNQLHLILLRIPLHQIGSPASLETGIEPVTPRLTVGCSNQLSYSSKCRAPLPYSPNSTGGIRTHEASAVDLKSTPFDQTRVQWILVKLNHIIIIWYDYVPLR